MADVSCCQRGACDGQRVHFELFAAEKNPQAIARYRSLMDEAFATLDNHLAEHPYLAGDEYSIADIAQFGWTHIAQVIDFDFSAYKHLSTWYQRISARPAVQRGTSQPSMSHSA